MDKLEAIKSKLRKMIEKCNEVDERRGVCSCEGECWDKLRVPTPETYLNMIERCENLLND